MLLEALVITVCTAGNPGCSEATSAYYQQSLVLQEATKKVEMIGNNILKGNEWLVYVGTPAYSIAVRKPAEIKIYKGTMFTVDPWKQAVGLQWNY